MATSAIPTKYDGIQFRSRTEAKWAAFMDLLGWSWEYEPLDFDGYIPDFLVNGDFWLEVKAAVSLEELEEEAPKVFRGLRGEGRPAVVVGGLPFFDTPHHFNLHTEGCCWDSRRLGIVAVDRTAAEPLREDKEWAILAAPVQWRKGLTFDYAVWASCSCRAYRLSEEFGAWGAMEEDDHFGEDLVAPNFDLLKSLWREASNITQWQPRSRGGRA